MVFSLVINFVTACILDIQRNCSKFILNNFSYHLSHWLMRNKVVENFCMSHSRDYYLVIPKCFSFFIKIHFKPWEYIKFFCKFIFGIISIQRSVVHYFHCHSCFSTVRKNVYVVGFFILAQFHKLFTGKFCLRLC